MRKPFKIGKKEYKTKKDAIIHYKSILNYYDFGQSLRKCDLEDVLELMAYKKLKYSINSVSKTEEVKQELQDEKVVESNYKRQDNLSVLDIKVSKVQFKTKCFEVFYDNQSSSFISYLSIINSKPFNPDKKFYVACRNVVHEDIRLAKQSFFDKYSVKGQVKCQETGILSKWGDLVVDHRQPNTFSAIVDRFKEVNRFDPNTFEYIRDSNNLLVFSDSSIAELFRNYHQHMANLRIVRKECNASRTAMARIKKSSRDIVINRALN